MPEITYKSFLQQILPYSEDKRVDLDKNGRQIRIKEKPYISTSLGGDKAGTAFLNSIKALNIDSKILNQVVSEYSKDLTGNKLTVGTIRKVDRQIQTLKTRKVEEDRNIQKRLYEAKNPTLEEIGGFLKSYGTANERDAWKYLTGKKKTLLTTGIDFGKQVENGPSQEQLDKFLIWFYTGEGYAQINTDLWSIWSGKNPESDLSIKLAKRTTEALERMEGFLNEMDRQSNQIVMCIRGFSIGRGVVKDAPERAFDRYVMQVGEIITEPSFISTSKNPEKDIAKEKTFRVEIDSNGCGRDVSSLSQHGGEEEVLFKAGQQFKVLAAKKIKDQYLIVLKAIPDNGYE